VTRRWWEAQRRETRRRRVVLLVTLATALLLGLVVVPWAVDKVRGRADPQGAEVKDLAIESDAVGKTLHTTVVIPEGARQKERNRHLLIFLHGRGGDDESFLGDAEMFKALARLGGGAPVVAFPDGGDHSYWHNRQGGNWDRYLFREVIPQVARSAAADTHRVAVGGISMGGFGAYDLVLHHPGRFCAVGGHSPALWRSASETAPGAFDDAADFGRNNVIGAARRDDPAFAGLPIWIDAGDADPFQPGDRAFRAALRSDGARLTQHLDWPGGHDAAYWNSHWLAYFRFYVRALHDCESGS
jgi:S-formylglutathione hydrolase FrmB